MPNRRSVPFMISLFSLLLVAGVTVFVIILLRVAPPDGPDGRDGKGLGPGDAAMAEAAREQLVFDLESRLRSAGVGWKHRAAASALEILSDSWEGTPFLAPPPEGLEVIEAGSTRTAIWIKDEPHGSDREAAVKVAREFLQSVKAVPYCSFEIITLEQSGGKVKADLLLELVAVTKKDELAGYWEKHRTVWEKGRITGSRRVGGRKSAGKPWFADAGVGSGLDVPPLPQSVEGLPLPACNAPYGYLGGVAVGDYDDDGDPDIFLPRLGRNLLYRNRGDATFEDVTDEAFPRKEKGPPGVPQVDPVTFSESGAALFLDYDNDGKLDLLVANHAPASFQRGDALQLFRNTGKGTFVDVTLRAGLTTQGPAMSLAAADVEGDGDLDIYVCMYADLRAQDSSVPLALPARYPEVGSGEANQLWINEGGKFIERAADAGVADRGWSLAAVFGDDNGDGLPELHVVNDFGITARYINTGGGRFEAAAEVGERGLGRSVARGDVDGDGNLDRYVPTVQSVTANRVFSSVREGSDAAALFYAALGGRALHLSREGHFIPSGQGLAIGWPSGCVFFDADHDGREDLYVRMGCISGISEVNLAAGYWRLVKDRLEPGEGGRAEYRLLQKYREGIIRLQDQEKKLGRFRAREAAIEPGRARFTFEGYQSDSFFHNQDGTLLEVGAVGGLSLADDGRGVVAADFDGDGDLDILARNFGDPPLRLMLNTVAQDRNWLIVRPSGQAVGARVMVVGPAGKQVREIACGSGYLSAGPPEAHFGLPGSEEVRVHVAWPGKGKEVSVGPVPPGKIVVVHPDGRHELKSARPPRKVEALSFPAGGLVEGDPLGDVVLQGAKQQYKPGDLVKPTALVFFDIYSAACQKESMQWKDFPGQELFVSLRGDRELVEKTLLLWEVAADPVTLRPEDRIRILGEDRPTLPTILIVKGGVVEAKLVGEEATAEAIRLLRP